MSNRAKLLISVLFIAAIVLTIGLTRFYFDVTKNTAVNSENDKIDRILKSYGDLQVFQNPNGYCGVVNADGGIVIDPEWLEILDVTPELVLVSRRMGEQVLIGGVDYEENVVLPFVYRSFQQIGKDCYAAAVAADGMVILYDSGYRMLLPDAYESAAFDSGLLKVMNGGCTFYYDTAGSSPVLRRAEMQTDIGGKRLVWRMANQVYLSDLGEKDLMQISRCISDYTTMLIEDDFTELTSISAGEFTGVLSKPGSMPDAQIDWLSSFSMAKQDDQTYDLAFTAAYHTPQSGDSTVQMHLWFRRSAERTMILTSATLDFQSAAQPTGETAADME